MRAIISLLDVKKYLNTFTEEPNIKNVVDIPNTNRTVFFNMELFINLTYPYFRLCTLLFDNMLK